MATIEDIQRKHAQFITSQNNIVDMIASYGVGISNDTPYQNFADMVKTTVSTKLAGIIDGITPFELAERDFSKITPISGVYIIGKYAFYRNAALKKVVVPDFVQSVEQYAFSACTGLTEVILKGKTNIQTGAFNGCTQLKKVYLSENSNIATSAFNGCTQLKEFYLPSATSESNVPKILDPSAFSNIHADCVFYVPDDNSLAIYENATTWCDLYKNYTFTTIGGTEND